MKNWVKLDCKKATLVNSLEKSGSSSAKLVNNLLSCSLALTGSTHLLANQQQLVTLARKLEKRENSREIKLLGNKEDLQESYLGLLEGTSRATCLVKT